MIQSTALIGLGAMGLLYADKIQESKGEEAISVILDERRMDSYLKRSFSINDRPVQFSFHSPGQEKDPVDLAIFAVKYGGLEEAIETMRPFIGPETTILSLLNGIVSEEDLSKAYSPDQVLLCVAQGMDATFSEDSLYYSRPGLLEIGVQESAQVDRLHELVAFLRSCDIEVRTPKNIRKNLWSKLMLNVGINQVLGVRGAAYGVVQKPGLDRERMIAAMREAIAVARAEGIDLGEEELQGYLRVVDSLSPKGKPSLVQDLEAGRKTEVELFSGTILALGQAHGLSTPVNAELYQAIKDLEGAGV